jgi:hypothetical protein
MSMPILASRLGTATLILTPKLLHRFGVSFNTPSVFFITELYDSAVRKHFAPLTRSKTVPDFAVRWKKATVNYSKQYDEILHGYAAILGTSRFKLEYVKQITEISKELRSLPFAALDVSELFRRHVMCCTNAAANYDDLFESDSKKLYAVDTFLRNTNFGLTLLVLLLDGTLTGPTWIMTEAHRLTSDALRKMESMPELHAKTGNLSGSLIFAEGNLDVTPEGRKPR